jgi:hypothetical protein
MTTNEPPPYPGDPTPAGSGLPSYGSVQPPEGGYPPPPPGGYPPPVGGTSPYSAPDAIGYGWKKFKENVGPFILGTLLVAVTLLALSFISQAIAPTPSLLNSDGQLEFDAGGTFAALVAQTITGTIGYIFSAMLVRGAIDVTYGESFGIGKAFSRLNVGKVLLTGLFLSVLTNIGIALFVLPGLVFGLFSFFTIYFVVDKDVDPFEGMASSFKLVAANFGDGFLTGLLAALVLIAGVICCLVGLLAAVPIVTLAAAYAYKSFTAQPIAP